MSTNAVSSNLVYFPMRTPMCFERRFQALPQAWQVIVGSMHRFYYGRVESFVFGDGTPQVDPPPVINWTVNFDAKSTERPEVVSGDFILEDKTRQMVGLFSKLGHGQVEYIDFQEGQPGLVKFRGKAGQ